MTTNRPIADMRLARENTFAKRTEEVLREKILDGAIRPGERLNEVALAASLGISRGPLREAIQRLTSEGLLTVITHRGAFVRTFSRAEVVELYELRAALELHAVRLACQRASDEDIQDLAVLLDETQERISETGNHAYPSELDFHLRVVMLASNPALLNRALETQRQLSLARSISAKQPMRARAAVVEHEELVEALTKRDRERATQLMEEHLQHSMDNALAALHLPADAAPDDADGSN